MNELLDLVQERLALGVVEFDRLLLKQRVNFGIVAVGIGTALDGEGFEAGRGVAESGAASHDQVLVFLFRIALEKRGALDRPQIGPDAGLPQIVGDGLADIRKGGITVKRAGLDAFGMSRRGQQLLRLCDIVNRLGRLPVEFKVGRHEGVVGQL